MSKLPDKPAKTAKSTREQRLAKALRDNLRRRKAGVKKANKPN